MKIAVIKESGAKRKAPEVRYLRSFGAAQVYEVSVKVNKKRAKKTLKRLLGAFSENGITCVAANEESALAESLKASGMTVFTETGSLAYLSGRMAIAYLDGIGADISKLFFRIEGSGRYAYLCAKELLKRTGKICFSGGRAEELSRRLLEETGVSATRRGERKDAVIIKPTESEFLTGAGLSASVFDFSLSAFSEEISLPLAAALTSSGFLKEKDIEIFLKNEKRQGFT